MGLCSQALCRDAGGRGEEGGGEGMVSHKGACYIGSESASSRAIVPHPSEVDLGASAPASVK